MLSFCSKKSEYCATKCASGALLPKNGKIYIKGIKGTENGFACIIEKMGIPIMALTRGEDGQDRVWQVFGNEAERTGN